MLKYVKGDVTKPQITPITNAVIIHCCNDCPGGVMGGGVAYAISRKWPNVKSNYHAWAKGGETDNSWESGDYSLGHVQLIPVEENLAVCNMIGQRDVVDFHKIPPVRYEAVREGLWRLRDWMDYMNKKSKWKCSEVISPLICSELAGGDWNLVEKIITEVFDTSGYNWTAYQFSKV